MTSALEDILANGDVVGGVGVSEVTIIFAVEVGDKCSVSGCAERPGDDLNVGFGRARICDRRLISRKFA